MDFYKMLEDYDASLVWKQRLQNKVSRYYNKIRDIKWWFMHRFHPKHRYNIIKIGPPGYYDIDQLLEKAMIYLFIKHVDVEREGLQGLTNSIKAIQEDIEKAKIKWNKAAYNCETNPDDLNYMMNEIRDQECWLNYMIEMKELYVYFTQKRLLLKEKQEAALYAHDHTYVQLEEELNHKDTEMFKRMIEIRGHFWS